MALFFPGLTRFYSEAHSAIIDFSFYPKVVNQPWRRTFLYLLFLSAHVAVILSLAYAWLYSSELRRFSDWAQRQLPVMEVKDGELTIHATQPLVRHYQGKNDITFVLDTTGRYTDPDSFSRPTVLLTRRELVLASQDQVQKVAWKNYGAFSVTPEQVRAWEKLTRQLYFPVSYSLLLVYTLFAKALTAVFLTGFAVVAAARYRVRLLFRNAFTIALYSLTPAIIIGLAVKFTGLEISYFQLIYLAIAAIYTYMGTQRCVFPGEQMRE
jgi:hypothetical protein